MKKLFLFLLVGVLGGAACKKVNKVVVHPNGQTIDLLSIMKVNFNFGLFYYALQKTGLDTLFTGNGVYTVLLPDNVAFAHAGIFRSSDLDGMNTDTLRAWMQLHILPVALPSTDIPQTINSPYTTVGGQILYFSNDGNGMQAVNTSDTTIRVNGDTLVALDTRATNGYIHVLNRPLSLPSPTIKSFLMADSNYSFFVTGLQRFGLLDQLDSNGPFTVLAPTNGAFTGEGVTLDSIAQMDSLHFQTILFSVGIIGVTRMFYADLNDPNFWPPTGYPNGPLPGGIALSFIYSSYILFLQTNPYWGAFDPTRSALNPAYNDGPTFFYGANSMNNVGIYGRGPMIVDPDHICINGVVHGLDDLLVFPDNVRKQ